MSYHPKPPTTKEPPIGKCPEDCRDLQDDIGELSQFGLSEWQQNLREQRTVAAKEKDIVDWETFEREIACVNKWKNECEPELSQCKMECPEVKEEFQSGTDVVLSRRARDVISNEALQIIDDGTKPRNEVVEAQKKLNCLLKYEQCLIEER